MGSYGQLSYACVDDLNFRVYTDEEIRKISVVQITNDQSVNELGHLTPDGLYDLRMGPVSSRERDVCQTCSQEAAFCSGHCGHIELPVPVYNPFFLDALSFITRRLCWYCYKIQALGPYKILLSYQMRLIQQGYGQEALEMEDIASRIVANDGGTAEEVKVNLEGRDIKGSEKGYVSMAIAAALEKELGEFYKKTIKGDTCSPDTSTSNVRGVHAAVLRYFKSHIRSDMKCIFCKNRMLKFSIVNSRFMITNVVPLNLKNAKKEIKKSDEAQREKTKKKPSKDISSSENEDSEEDEDDDDNESNGMEAKEAKKKTKKVKETKVDNEDDVDSENEETISEKSIYFKIVVNQQTYVTPEQLRTVLRKLWDEECEVLKVLYPGLAKSTLQYPTDMFFLQTILVVPPKFRPLNYQGGMTIEHEISTALKGVIKLSKCLTFLMSIVKGTIEEVPETLQYIISEVRGSDPLEKSQNVWFQLQGNVDCIYDSTLNQTVSVTKKGIKQLIETKEGLFRQNLMGKRVNYSARSVGAPDPLLAVDEVGVPLDFAVKLSYPVPVTQWNVEEMRQLVINGPHEYPGAVMVEDEEGKRKRLDKLDKAQRIAIANQLLTPKESHVRKVNATKIVYRHLMNGDFVLMNRQPTLHRPSIQAHRARVMPNDRVLRMPYANCKAYNADFDGDELNMHFPQNELARSESQHLITTKNQYLTPKDGSPLAGLIQDSVVSSVMLTMRGTFFSKEDYQQLLFSALSDETRKIEVLPPSIIKPKMLWSGKQVISSLLHNIIPKNKARPSFRFKTSVKVDLWQKCEARQWKAGGSKLDKKESMTESEFVMRDGELLCGVIDKSAIGSTSHGLVHTCYDLYGGSVAAKVLTAINRVCVYYLQWAGHTISVREFVTPGHVNKKRISSLAALIARTPQGVSEKLNITEEEFGDYFEEAHMSGNEKEMAAIDAAYTSVLGPTTSEVAVENEKGLFRSTLDNHMRMMVDTGAKGSKVNMMQLASLFGSVAIDGKRMPMSITGKFLPSFKPYEANPRAGGYIARRFMTGMDPQAYFYLCIVGRDSLQHTAVKTANSGYLQRCLIKHLEGIQVKYDMTVRNSDGLVLQFNYGEDGLDVTKVPFLKDISTMDSLTNNYSRLLDDRSVSIAKSVGDKEEVDRHIKKLKSWQHKFGTANKTRRSGFLKFSKKHGNDVGEDGFCNETGRPNAALALQDMWWSLPDEDKVKYKKVGNKCPDPVNSVFSGSANLGVISEALEELIDKYYSECYSKKPIHEQPLSQEEVATTIHMKSLTSMVDPGEAVGALCAQAIGEPLTQMTLNTFHFAGRDELNVTLGVPRMIEILRSASKNISTPIMEIPFHAHITKAQANALRVMLTEVPLGSVIHKLGVRSKLEFDDKGRLHRKTAVKFTFLSHSQYRRVYTISPSDVLQYMEQWFIAKVLLKEIERSFGRSNTLVTADMEERKRRRGKKAEDEEDEPEAVMTDKTESTTENADAPDSSEDEDEPEADVEDGTLATHIKKGKEGDDYDEVEDEEKEKEEKEDRDEVSEDEGIEEDEADLEKEEEVTFIGAPQPKKKKSAIGKPEVLKRRKKLLEQGSWIVDYEFDHKEEEWCEVTFMLPVSGGNYDIPSIVRQKAKISRVHAVPGIGRAFVVDDKDSLLLRTEGINVHKMFEYEHLLDVNRLYTNNIHMVAEMYGIEAAQRSIIRELRAVQSAYDIKVDFRHLTLLADYFTCEGVYKACSRMALATCVSPMQKMSYETSMNFLKTAVLQGESDKMNSPSANIALGQPIKVGTNVMHVLPVIKL